MCALQSDVSLRMDAFYFMDLHGPKASYEVGLVATPVWPTASFCRLKGELSIGEWFAWTSRKTCRKGRPLLSCPVALPATLPCVELDNVAIKPPWPGFADDSHSAVFMEHPPQLGFSMKRVQVFVMKGEHCVCSWPSPARPHLCCCYYRNRKECT